MTSRRTLSVLLVAALVAALVAPAHADQLSTARRRQEEARRRRAAAAAQLDTLRVSDRQLERALADLDADVDRQAAAVAAAGRAVEAADAEAVAARGRLERMRDRIARLREELEATAVAAYVRPAGDVLTELLRSRDLTEASRKQALLTQVSRSQRDVLDELGAAEDDLVALEKAAVEAAAMAHRRRQDESRRLTELTSARAAQARLAEALDARIAHIQGEAEALARQEAALASFIRRKEAEARQAALATLRGSTIEPDGRVSVSGLMWPVRGPVTSEYGQRWGRLHAGIDISAPTGRPIRAAKEGTVIRAGSMSGYGNVVILQHGSGFTTLYAHQSRLAVGEGATVARGSVIGYVGSTGHSTGPHLHFETRVDGNPQNPRRYLP